MAESGVRKKLSGIVVSNKMNKTAVVQVSRVTRHKTYLKYIKSNTKYLVHDPNNQCKIGDKVRLVETRPLSKNKRWRIAQIENSAI